MNDIEILKSLETSCEYYSELDEITPGIYEILQRLIFHNFKKKFVVLIKELFNKDNQDKVTLLKRHGWRVVWI